MSAAPVVSGAGKPAAQTSATKKKKKKTSKSKHTAKPAGQKAPTPDRIREIQTALQKQGMYEGEPSGKWDDATAQAMQKFQDKNGINPTGKIDALSLEKLGLGSETAGKGAPVPVSTAAAPTSSSPK